MSVIYDFAVALFLSVLAVAVGVGAALIAIPGSF
ncbi:hypothetical protein SAMN05428953_12654 [Mesorhizobium muleiense]|uniref:Uncharacterized protein n=1 Tax=Mesorhizobium muleiense TaxID=1004279 RepID=A0A1G9H3G0_9HYPH|nr:hypothetical protein SAMN05428953_12654 [Mesorhizobium muleiense]